MKKMILGWFLYGTAVGLCAQAPQGDFKGSIQIGQTTMPIVFHFGQQNGQPTTTMDSPAQGVFGFPVQSSECLSDGELTLKIPQIAVNVGYSNTKYFYRVFKKLTGYTPEEYRTLP